MEDSQSKELERRHRILAKLSFRELSNSKLSGLRTLHNMRVSLSQKLRKNQKGIGCGNR